MAGDLVAALKPHGFDSSSARILEWGCGPGRIIRHIPPLLGPNAEIYGSDYNRNSIQWATDSIKGVKFVANDLHPPLPFTNNSLDVVYCNSVFTHLAEETCAEWISEIHRVLKQNGLFFFTTHSDKIAEFLLPWEKQIYSQNGCVVRGNFTEGKKMFLAFHSPDYVKRKWMRGFNLLEHYVPGKFEYIHAQDAFLARKTE